LERSSKQRNNNIKETSELSDTIDKMGLTDSYRIFHPMTAEHT
jgi:hypothetical protein